jgi:hypothetical protein
MFCIPVIVSCRSRGAFRNRRKAYRVHNPPLFLITPQRVAQVTFTYLLCSVLLGVFCLRDAFAVDFGLTSNTHFQFREDSRGNDFATLYQYFDLELTEISGGRFSIFSSGRIRTDLRSTIDGSRESDELTYAYASYSPFADRRLILNAGRHFVFEGIASEQIDGVSGKWDMFPMVGVSAYGGVPVETDFDDRSADYIYGGRIYLRLARRGEVGFSYLRERNDDAPFREEWGIDVWAQPLGRLEIQGHSFWNNITEDWMEHAYAVHVVPSERFDLTLQVSHINYKAAFFATTLSAFRPDFVGRDEEVSKVGPSMEYHLNDWLTGTADYTYYHYDQAGDAHFYGFGLTAYRPIDGIAMGASIHRMDGSSSRLRYVKYRAYATKSFEALEISLDTVNLHYDKSFQGVDNSYSISGSLTYKLLDALLVSATMYYGKNPDFDHEIRVFLNISYNFTRES